MAGVTTDAQGESSRISISSGYNYPRFGNEKVGDGPDPFAMIGW